MQALIRGFTAYRPALVACIAALLATACGPTIRAGCFEDQDPMTGADFQWCGDDAIGGQNEPLRADVDLLSLTPVRAKLGGNTYYYLRLRYQGSGWVVIAPGSQISINWPERGEPLVLTTRLGSRPDSIRHVEGRYGVANREAADYGTDAETIGAIAGLRQVTVSLKTGDRQLETTLRGSNLKPFRQFVSTYMTKN